MEIYEENFFIGYYVGGAKHGYSVTILNNENV